MAREEAVSLVEMGGAEPEGVRGRWECCAEAESMIGCVGSALVGDDTHSSMRRRM